MFPFKAPPIILILEVQNKSSINCLRLSLALLIDLNGTAFRYRAGSQATSIFFEILVIP